MAWPFTVPVDFYADNRRVGRAYLRTQTIGHRQEVLYIARHVARLTNHAVMIRVKGELVGYADPEGSAGLSNLYPPGAP